MPPNIKELIVNLHLCKNLINQNLHLFRQWKLISVHSLFCLVRRFFFCHYFLLKILTILFCFTGGVQNGINSWRNGILSGPVRQQVLTSRMNDPDLRLVCLYTYISFIISRQLLYLRQYIFEYLNVFKSIEVKASSFTVDLSFILSITSVMYIGFLCSLLWYGWICNWERSLLSICLVCVLIIITLKFMLILKGISSLF